MRLGLFESAWLGSQAFFYASAFNANIGAWNTASMTTMSSVCAVFCHRLCVRRVWLGLGCGAAWPGCRRPWPMEPRMLFAVHSFFCASLISGAYYFASSIVRKLFGSVRLRSQAFSGATAFNANIGSWNTAAMETMASVCLHCHRLRVGRVWLGLA
jgi:hypothetical protein